MDRSPDMNNLSRLNYEKIENLNRSVKSKEVKSAIKHLPSKKNPGSHVFMVEFYKCFKKSDSQSF